MLILSWLGTFMLTVGIVFLFLGALGIFRMPDVYSRLQAGTKATTLGALGTILGVGLIQPDWFFKTLVIAVFIAISNPISSHALARAAHRSGLKPTLGNKNIDEYEDYIAAKLSDKEIEGGESSINSDGAGA